MRMRVQRWWRLTSALLLFVAAGLAARAQAPPEPAPSEPPAPSAPAPTPPPAPAEAPAPETPAVDDRLGHWSLDVEQWVAQPSGLEYVSVLVDNPTNPAFVQQFGPTHGTEGNLRFDVGFAMRNEKGRFSFKYWSHDDEAFYSVYDPGTFALGEHFAPLRFAGLLDDGTADAMDTEATTRTRDARFDYSRLAFNTRHVIGRWTVGLREVDHNRSFNAAYYALVTNLPAVVGRPDLDPLPDRAGGQSNFSGRGPNFGFDVDLPLGKRFRVSAGVSTAILRGDISSGYSSVSRVYVARAGDPIDQVLGADLPEFLNEWVQIPTPPPRQPDVLQLALPAGVVNYSRSASAQVLEGALSVRYRAWRTLEVFAGLRSTRYDDVGLEVRPTLSETSLVGQTPRAIAGIDGLSVTVPVVGVVETTHSVNYDGFFLGLGYTY